MLSHEVAEASEDIRKLGRDEAAVDESLGSRELLVETFVRDDRISVNARSSSSEIRQRSVSLMVWIVSVSRELKMMPSPIGEKMVGCALGDLWLMPF
jgi:hypothetical protein